MIKTSKLHTIYATEHQLKKNLYGAYAELLHADALGDGNNDVETFENDIHRIDGLIQDIRKNGFIDLFKDGYTMMLLDPEDFKFVEDWMNKPNTENEDLQIVIARDNKTFEYISHIDISF
jgi:hypothetical protein